MKKHKYEVPSGIFPTGAYELQIIYRRISPHRVAVRQASDALSFCRTFVYPDGVEYAETFNALFLDKANKIFCWKNIGVGGLSGTVADVRLVMQSALLAHCTSIIIVHNHPSGNIQPSEADRSLTKKFSEAGKFLEIAVLDHLVITSDSYYSFADEGLL